MKDRPTLTAADLRRVNLDLSQSAQEQRDDESPPFRPRLSKRPKPTREAA